MIATAAVIAAAAATAIDAIPATALMRFMSFSSGPLSLYSQAPRSAPTMSEVNSMRHAALPERLAFEQAAFGIDRLGHRPRDHADPIGPLLPLGLEIADQIGLLHCEIVQLGAVDV